AARGFQIKRDGKTPEVTDAPGIAAKPQILVAVESLGVAGTAEGPSRLSINGWALAAAPISEITAAIGGVVVGRATYGLPRPDIRRLYPGRDHAGHSGLLLSLALPSTARRPIAPLLPVSHVAREIGRRPVVDEGFHHHCDEIALTTAGHLVVKGWAVSGAPIVALEVLLDGDTAGQAELGIERADVGNLFPRLPHARQSGFGFTRQTRKTLHGEHLIGLRLRRADDEIDEIAFPVRATEAAPPPAIGSGDTVGDGERRLHLDAPALVSGVMEMPLRGNLEIGGWALARAGVAAVEIAIDGVPMANADYGVRRLDIQASFPDWENALGSGFLALVPHR